MDRSPLARSPLRVALGVALVVTLAGCGKHGVGAPGAGANPTPAKAKLKRHVELAQVRQDQVEVFVETVGFLDAEGQTDIAAGVSGIVEQVLFREGDHVEEGTVLVRIDARRYAAMMAQAEANLKKAEAQVEKCKATGQRAEAGRRDAEETFALKGVLLENIRRAGRSATNEQRQEAMSNVEVARARVGVAQSELAVCKAELEASLKEVEAARALVALAKHNLDRSSVRAPYTGQINQRKVTVGSYLEEKSPVATMADLTRLRLVGYIPEKSAPIVRAMLQQEQRTRTVFLVGSCLADPWSTLVALTADHGGDTPASFQLEFTLRPFPEQKFRGRIFYLSTVASPDTHMFECKAEVPVRGLQSELRPGYTAKIRCPLPSNPRAVIIPEEAVRASERGDIVFRPRAVTNPAGEAEWVAEAVTVDLGSRTPGVVEVKRTLPRAGEPAAKKAGSVEVLRGIRPGDWIVRKGAEALEDNTPLEIPKAQIEQLKKETR